MEEGGRCGDEPGRERRGTGLGCATVASDGDGRERAVAPLVTGQVVIAAAAPAFCGAIAHVYLEDVSYVDAAAAVVAEAVIPDVRHEPTGDGGDGTLLPFALHAPPGATTVDPRNDYAVRVWVDRDGDGQQGPGDLYSDQSYRVLTRGFGRTVTIMIGSR